MKLTRGAAAGAALALVGLMGASGAAFAADVETVDPNESGSLTIHKYLQPASQGAQGTGVELDEDTTKGWEAVDGVPFTVQQVTCDDDALNLTTNAGWAKASELVAELTAANETGATWAPPAGCSLEDPGVTETTAGGGIAEFDLPVGLYYVTEGDYTGTDMDLAKGLPFLVSIPLPNPTSDGGRWMYDVHVYPKNQATSISKSADDSELAKVGDEVSFTITTGIPGGELTKYVVTDPLHPGLTFDSLSVAINPASAGEQLVEGEDGDYTISEEPGEEVYNDANELLGRQNVVKVTFTADGMKKLSKALEANPNAVVDTHIVTTLNDKGIDGVTNSASYTFDNGSGETTVDTGDGGVEITMGTKNIVKQGKDGDKVLRPLAGAKFDLYVSHTQNPSWDGSGSDEPTLVTSDIVSATGTGKIDVGQLRSTMPSSPEEGPVCNKDAVVEDGCNFYWLVETEAPADYELLAAPVMFTIDNNTDAQNIENIRTDSSTSGTLPLTGMSGIIFMVLAGGLVLTGAGYGMYRVSRNKA